MREEEVIQRVKKIHELDKNGDKQEAKKQFKELMQDSVSWCTHCRRYRHIERDESTSDKPFHFCVICGQRINKISISDDKLIEMKFHYLHSK